MSRNELNYEILLEVTNVLNLQRDWQGLWGAITKQIQRVVPWDRAGILLYDPKLDGFRFHAVVTNVQRPALSADTIIPRTGSAMGWVYDHRQVHVRPNLHQKQVFLEDKYYLEEGLGRMINFPLIVHDECLGTLNIGSRQVGDLDPEDVKFLQLVATHIATAIAQVRAYEEIRRLGEQLKRQNEYLVEEVKLSRNVGTMVGQSSGFRHILDLIRAVAPTSSSVLLLGETGTGKELLARAVHEGSPRHNKPFIRVNCAALPGGLVESELFGHERGAFTGASAQRPGRFELANGGTLFLDEIGEMPLEAQAKLLRVLQDGMVDRIGSTTSVPVDVRIVAATNAQLEDAIKKGTFRADLYYRLHVFPVSVPPLRERQEDIPLLADHFLAQAAARLRRGPLRLSPQSMERLMNYSWPGNVRELQNLIDRAAILTTGGIVEIEEAFFPKTSPPPTPSAPQSPPTLHQLEQDHIVATLNKAGWRIYGPDGAAARLGLNPETLRSRIRKLGLKKPSQSASV